MSVRPHALTVNWLHKFLSEAVRLGWCTQIRCTTCGAREFRDGLARRLAEVPDVPLLALFNSIEGARILSRELCHLRPSMQEQAQFAPAVRLIFYDLWWHLGNEVMKREVEPLLEKTWAREILDGMYEHAAVRRAHR